MNLIRYRAGLSSACAVAVFFIASIAFAQNAAVEAQSTAKIKKTAQKSWKVFATYENYFGFRDGAENIGAFYFIGSNRFSWGSLQIFQPVIKYFEVDPGEPETQAGDTLVRFFSNPYSFIDNITFRYRVDSSLPISEFSRDNDVITRPGLQAIFEGSAFDNKLYLSLRPLVRYSINEFTTTETGPGNTGGRPLTLWTTGATMLGVYSLAPKLTLAGAASYFRITYEQTERRNLNPGQPNSNLPVHRYLLDLSLSYQLNKTFTLTSGYSIDSTAERYGGVEFLAYDEDISIWYLSGTATF